MMPQILATALNTPKRAWAQIGREGMVKAKYTCDSRENGNGEEEKEDNHYRRGYEGKHYEPRNYWLLRETVVMRYQENLC
jgi:hypothetical protein